jgi:glutamyl/glutaminyl-tRNA synthetase
LAELEDSIDFFFKEKLDYEKDLLLWKKNDAKTTAAYLKELLTKLSEVATGDWTSDILEQNIVSWLKEQEKSLGDYLWPMRVALSGRKASPGPFEIAAVIGQKETLLKINEAISRLS